jgi:hypothetical protein
MDWNPPQEEKTWVLDDIFDRQKGWYISENEASVRRVHAPDGNPAYLVTVGRITIVAFEAHVWAAGSEKNVTAGRLCAYVAFEGIEVTDPKAFLFDSFDTKGLPSFGLDPEDMQPVVQTAFPIAPEFPVDLARRQLLVCMGLLSIEGEKLLTAWSADSSSPRGGSESIDWDMATHVAGVAATFLRSFVGF